MHDEIKNLLWKPDCAEAVQACHAWWEHRGLALAVYAPRDKPIEDVPLPPPNPSLETRWLDPHYWVQARVSEMTRTFYGGAALPYHFSLIGGPGSLGLFLGAKERLAEDTLWYDPCIIDPDRHPPLRPDWAGASWQRHMIMLSYAVEQARGRYLVGMPDLIENLDTLAQLRGGETLLMDLIERPAWVRKTLEEINQAYFQCHERMWDVVRDPWGGSVSIAFAIWGPGKMSKVQCDFSVMISEAMFREFVVPPLIEQCEWLDHSYFHVDGTQALHHLPALLEIEALDAIEWTPQAGLPGGGSPRWFDLYRQIKAAGKSVLAIGVAADEILPLIDAVGPEGLYINTWVENETTARECLRRIGWKGVS
ncbi:MAG: hypothetical protein PHR35_06865 [Kiritimatiellae bacterium]|nr:hypothetical protein [Kiritimatiellia bacterium]